MRDHAACLPPPRFPSLLTTWPSCADGLGPASCPPCWHNEPASCCWPPTAPPTRDRPTRRGLAADRHRLPTPVWPPRPGRIARPAPARSAADRVAAPAHRNPPGHPQPTTDQAGRYALVDPAAGTRARREPRHDRPYLARVRRAALAGRDLQVLHRCAARHRHQESLVV